MKAFLTITLFLNLLTTPICYSQNQFFDWAKQISGNVTSSGNHDNGKDIFVDSLGKIYSTGIFNGTCDFSPAAGGEFLYSSGMADSYVLKQNPDGSLNWVKQILRGSEDKSGVSITTDNDGNIYTTGYFNGQVDVDPSAAVMNITSNGQEDIFINKLDSSGNLIWFKRIGGTSEDYGEEIIIDVNGDLYVTGHFYSTVDFDPGPGVQNLVSNGYADFFILKLDSNGNFIWVKQVGGGLGDFAYSIAQDTSGNTYTTGVYPGTVDFDPGVGTFNLTSAGSGDLFVLKLDPSGNFIWARSTGGISTEEVNSIDVTPDGSSYIAGYFYLTVDFDPGPSVYNLTSMSSGDIFVQKLDPNGNFIWAKQAMCSVFGEGQSLALGPNGNVYVGGYFFGDVDFDPGPNTYTLTSALGSNSDMFIQALDSLGDFIWAKAIGYPGGYIFSNSVYVDKDANVYNTGTFNNTVDFDPSPGVFTMTALGNFDAFVHKLRSCVSNLTTTITDSSIISNNTYNVDFQWLNCSDSSEIIGEQNQSFTPLVNGYYALEITENGCVDTSDCILFDNIPCISDLTLTLTDSSIISNNMDSVTFQWLDCSDSSQIIGEQNQIFTPQVNGYYAVEITNNGCSDTSECILFENIVCVSDLTLTVTDSNIVSNNMNAVTFQWLDCSDFSPILGEQSQSFAPQTNGEYAVEITENGCVDTSNCVVINNLGLVSANWTHQYSIYPNPTKEYLTLDFGLLIADVKVIIRDYQGRLIFNSDYVNTKLINLEIPFSKGVYFLEIKTIDVSVVKSFIIK